MGAELSVKSHVFETLRRPTTLLVVISRVFYVAVVVTLRGVRLVDVLGTMLTMDLAPQQRLYTPFFIYKHCRLHFR